jgi:hypothetical protein
MLAARSAGLLPAQRCRVAMRAVVARLRSISRALPTQYGATGMPIHPNTEERISAAPKLIKRNNREEKFRTLAALPLTAAPTPDSGGAGAARPEKYVENSPTTAKGLS